MRVEADPVPLLRFPSRDGFPRLEASVLSTALRQQRFIHDRLPTRTTGVNQFKVLVVQSCLVRLQREDLTMLAILGIILLVAWLLGFIAFHVTVGFIHILLALAIILFVLHFVRGSSAPA